MNLIAAIILVQIMQLCTEYELLTKRGVCKDAQMLSLVVAITPIENLKLL